MKKIRLLYCIPALYNPGGMERILTEKINYLSQLDGFKITIVTTDQMGKELLYEINTNIEVIHLNLDFNALYALPLLKKIKQTKIKLKEYKKLLIDIIKNKNIDICISTGGKELEFLHSKYIRCKKVLEIHFAKNFREQFLLARNNNYFNKFIGRIRTKQLEYQTKNLDAVVVLTKDDEISWKRNNNIYQIYNFSSVVTDKNPDYNKRRAIAVGKLDAQKGFDMLIDAWNINKDKLKDWTLDIFGQGEWEEMLQNKIISFGLEKNIFLKGVTKNIQNEFLNSSLFLFSSRYEGFSLVFIEAMNCALPVISFNCPQGPSELIANNDIGLLIPEKDIRKFANGILTLTSNEDLRKSMGYNAKQKALQFSKTEIMKQWTDLFESLVEN